MEEKIEIRECPLCNDPMEIHLEHFRHSPAAKDEGCLLRDLSWSTDKRYVDRWNRRANDER